MRFTWVTYFVALDRAIKAEVQAFQDHNRAVRGPEAWIKAYEFTDRLKARRRRELYSKWRKNGNNQG